MPDDWTLIDQSDVCNIVEQLLLHIDGKSASLLVKKLFKETFILPEIIISMAN